MTRPEVARAVTLHHLESMVLLGLGIVLPAMIGCSRPARPSLGGTDWPAYGGGPEQSRYSRLAQINTTNVAELKVAWTHDAGEPGGLQTQPIVIDGVMYGMTPRHRAIALNALTGELVWSFDSGLDSTGPNRGVTYWRDGSQERLFVAVDNYLYALDPGLGRPLRDFGDGGRVDLREGLGRDSSRLSVRLTSPGIIYRDIIIIGGRVSEGPGAAPGDVRAYDVRTGTLRWRFRTIPHPGEAGYETWPSDAWTYSGGANNWAGMALDRDRGIVYVPTGSATADFYGADRTGDNLFANSLLALRADNGERIWHFQTVHHDLWDRDLPAPPNLVSLTVQGRPVDAVAQVTKQGFVFVFDRVTGIPLFPVEERPVPTAAVDGERASLTQPIPLKPQPFARQVLDERTLANRTPAGAEAARAALRQVVSAGQFVPLRVGQETVVFPGFDGGAEWGGAAVDPVAGVMYVNSNEMPWTGSLTGNTRAETGRGVYLAQCASCHGDDLGGAPPQMPALTGLRERMPSERLVAIIKGGVGRMPGFPGLEPGANDAVIHYLLSGEDKEISATATGGWVVGQRLRNAIGFVLGRPGPATTPEPDKPRFRFTGYKKMLDADGYPAVAPPWGTLNALNLNTAEYLWRIPLGEYPELATHGLGNTGSENYGGPIVTAGGLVFIAATSYDRKFRAFDKITGRLLWEAQLPFAGNATPITYEVGGRQFVLIAAGGGKAAGQASGGVYVAFSLAALPPLVSTNIRHGRLPELHERQGAAK